MIRTAALLLGCAAAAAAGGGAALRRLEAAAAGRRDYAEAARLKGLADAAARAEGGADAGGCLRVLFVGNSLTYGKRPYGQDALNSLPRLFKLVAASMGRCVTVAEDTVGACTLHAHRPSVSPDGCAPCECRHAAPHPTVAGSSRCLLAERAAAPGQCMSCGCDCRLVDNYRVPGKLGCTMGNRSIDVSDGDYYPCPQLLTREQWDWVVMQDHSALPTVRAARERYMRPTVAEFVDTARATGAKVAMYMTQAYYNGSHAACPGGDGGQPACWPFGTLNQLLKGDPRGSCATWSSGVSSYACHTYSLARAYAESALYDAHALVPCGLAWLGARGAPAPADACVAAVDAEYPAGAPTGLPPLPLRWNTTGPYTGAAAQQLYRYGGATFYPQNHYCDDGCHIDLHASALGMYLNALVFYATLFRDSPLGADFPQGQIVDGKPVPGADMVRGDGTNGTMTAAEAQVLQQIAAETVMPYLDWWHPTAAGPHPSLPTPAPPAPATPVPASDWWLCLVAVSPPRCGPVDPGTPGAVEDEAQCDATCGKPADPQLPLFE